MIQYKPEISNSKPLKVVNVQHWHSWQYINHKVKGLQSSDICSYNEFLTKIKSTRGFKSVKFTPQEKKFLKALYNFITIEGYINPNAEQETDFPF